MPKVFISHSWDDNVTSRQLADYLLRDGAEVWIDYAKIEGGDSLPKVIGRAIEWCDTLLLVWSASAVDSFFVELEWECALTNRKRIIPCLVDETRLPTLLTNKLFIDFRDFKSGYRALARALRLKIREDVPKPEIKKTEEARYRKPPEVEPKIPVVEEPTESAAEIKSQEIPKPSLPEDKSKRKPPASEAQPGPTPKKGSNFFSTQIKKKWLRRIAVMLALAVLIVGGFKIIPKIVSRGDGDYLKQATSKEPQNEQGLSAEDVKKMLKDNNLFDSDWNPDAPGFENAFGLQTIEGQKVVIDSASGLMWQQSGSPEYFTYAKAKEYINQLNRERFAGFNNWRLPTLKEAMSLMEPDTLNGNLYIDPKFDPKQSWIWTADLGKGESWAWVVFFFYGLCYNSHFPYSSHVRALRSGQSSGGH